MKKSSNKKSAMSWKGKNKSFFININNFLNDVLVFGAKNLVFFSKRKKNTFCADIHTGKIDLHIFSLVLFKIEKDHRETFLVKNV